MMSETLSEDTVFFFMLKENLFIGAHSLNDFLYSTKLLATPATPSFLVNKHFLTHNFCTTNKPPNSPSLTHSLQNTSLSLSFNIRATIFFIFRKFYHKKNVLFPYRNLIKKQFFVLWIWFVFFLILFFVIFVFFLLFFNSIR